MIARADNRNGAVSAAALFTPQLYVQRTLQVVLYINTISLQSAARGTYVDSYVFTDSPLGTAARAVVRLCVFAVIETRESGGVAGDTIMDLDTIIAMLLLSQDMDMDSPRTRTWSSCRFLACMLEVVSVVFV